MDIRIRSQLLKGRLAVPSSKSDAHRLVICAALSDAPTQIILNQVSDDIQATLNCLQALGANYRLRKVAVEIDTIPGELAYIGDQKTIKRARVKYAHLSCQESGTTLRFMLPIAAFASEEAQFYGSGRLGARPLEPLLQALREHGCTIELAADGAAADGAAGLSANTNAADGGNAAGKVTCDGVPADSSSAKTDIPMGSEQALLRVRGPLQSGSFTLPGDVSSQFISGLLLALPNLQGDSEIHINPPFASRGYVDMTLQTLKEFNVQIEQPDAFTFIVPGGQHYQSPRLLAAQGDWSNAAFWLAANVLGSDVQVDGLLENSAQGDKAVADLLRLFSQAGSSSSRPEQAGQMLKDPGASTAIPDILDVLSEIPTTIRDSQIAIDVDQIPDLVPILAVVAAATPIQTVFSKVGRLRDKESDRLHAVIMNLTALGVEAYAWGDQLVVNGQTSLNGGIVESFGDHRIVMAFSIAGTISKKPVIIKGAEAVSKSYPHFFEDFKRLGGICDVL
ncbi:MAG: 3-phosphoshikimate 1-carboxyvinyltransferase [Coriobacteriales bacterium]|jgi:3-phosphoshikimate 1-carboxyvinyltransferase|nr:3-phosphoshikimate 1-carboxyvinyltransferase [Coriobacteriales bacterium]